jgi:orotate phosphoribosyltransferase
VAAHADAVADRVTALVVARRGHFRMESGYHSGAWFELGSLFDHPDELRPFITDLSRRIAAHGADAVCGPMTGGAKLAQLVAATLHLECFEAERSDTGATGLFPIGYRITNAQRDRARGRSVAVVDDAISAGSAVRATYSDLIACGARPVTLGALIVFGDAADHFAAERGLALEAIERAPLEMWLPAACPLCSAGVAIDAVSAG